jgi:hypothetical protein
MLLLLDGGSWKDAIRVGVSFAVVYWGVRTAWKYQHRLNLRGYLVQAGAILVGAVLIALAFRVPRGPLAATLIGFGGFGVLIFLLFPDVVYYSLRFWDHVKSRQ